MAMQYNFLTLEEGENFQNVHNVHWSQKTNTLGMRRPANSRLPRHFNGDKTDDEVTTKHKRLEKNNNNN